MIQSLLIFSALLLLTLTIRIREGSWYSPFSFFALLWTFIIGFSIFTAPEYFYSARAIAFIALNVFIFYAAGQIAEHFSSAQQKKIPSCIQNNKLLDTHLSISIFAGFLSLYFLLHQAGVVFTELFNKNRLVQVSKIFTDNRYAGERLSSMTMLCMMIAYSGCLTAGRLFVISTDKKGKIKSGLVLLPILLFTIIYTARAVFIYAMFLFLSSLITHYILVHGKKALLFNRRNLIFMLIALVGLPVMFLVTQAVRMGITKYSTSAFFELTDHLKVWFSGNVSAFSFWFEQDDKRNSIYHGAYTFAGLNEWLGGKTRDVGIYSKSFDLDGHFHFSNIYTLFRFLIDDFGIAGTFIFWFVLGIFSRMLYRKILNGDFIASAILSGIFTLILFSFVASVFAYNTVLFAWLIYVLISYISERPAHA
jgi:oligosaccharide repeat unit polymerase